MGAGGQHTQIGVAGLNAAALQIDLCPLRTVEGGVEVEALQAIVLEGQLRTLQVEFALRCFQRAGDIDLPVDLPAQLRPELSQTRQLDINLPGEFLLQTALAADAVVAETDLQGIQIPLFASAISLGLEDRRLPTQFAFQVEVGGEAQAFVFHFALAFQRSS
ncbi:hypothetical protein D3C72_656900 [compost metagenome]